MSCDSFPVQIVNAAESRENRAVRAQLRLSSRWKVLDKSVDMRLDERSDDAPEPVVVPAPDLKNREHISRGCVEIYVSAVPAQRYLCPVCGCSCRPMSYEERWYHHLPEQGCECCIVARIPKLSCRGCGGTPQVPFPLCDRRVSYTKDLAEEVMCALAGRSRSAVA